MKNWEEFANVGNDEFHPPVHMFHALACWTTCCCTYLSKNVCSHTRLREVSVKHQKTKDVTVMFPNSPCEGWITTLQANKAKCQNRMDVYPAIWCECAHYSLSNFLYEWRHRCINGSCFHGMLCIIATQWLGWVCVWDVCSECCGNYTRWCTDDHNNMTLLSHMLNPYGVIPDTSWQIIWLYTRIQTEVMDRQTMVIVEQANGHTFIMADTFHTTSCCSWKNLTIIPWHITTSIWNSFQVVLPKYL